MFNFVAYPETEKMEPAPHVRKLSYLADMANVDLPYCSSPASSRDRFDSFFFCRRKQPVQHVVACPGVEDVGAYRSHVDGGMFLNNWLGVKLETVAGEQWGGWSDRQRGQAVGSFLDRLRPR